MQAASGVGGNVSLRELDDVIRLFSYLDLTVIPADNSAAAAAAPAVNPSAQALQKLSTTSINSEKLITVLMQLHRLRNTGIKDLPLKSARLTYTDDATGATITEKSAVEKKIESLDAVIRKTGLTISERNSKPLVSISDSFLRSIYQVLEASLTKEENKEALEILHTTHATTDDKDHLLSLERMLRGNATINLKHIMKASKAPSKSDLTGQDVIVLLGQTGVGKTTSMHFIAGTKFKRNLGAVRVHKWPALAEGFQPAEGAVSGTKQINTIDLSQKPPKLFIDYGLSAPLLLCDTPGFGDTNGGEAAIINGLSIVHPLRTAKTVRVLVLISTDDFSKRGDDLLKTVVSVTRMMPGTANYTKSIYYAFTGDPKKDFVDSAVRQIDSLLAAKTKGERKFSDDVQFILQDMKTKMLAAKKTPPIINPEGSVTTTPQALMSSLLALAPISDARKAFVPFVEEADQQALANQLMRLFASLSRLFTGLEKNIAEGLKEKFSPDLEAIADILEQIAFVHHYLEPYDQQKYFDQCRDVIVKFTRFLSARTGQIFDATRPERKLTDDDILQYRGIYKILMNLRETWKNFYGENIPHELSPSVLYSEINKYRSALIKMMGTCELDQAANFEKQLTQQVLQLDETTASAKEKRPMLALEGGDDLVNQQMTNTLAHLKVRSLDDLRVAASAAAVDAPNGNASVRVTGAYNLHVFEEIPGIPVIILPQHKLENILAELERYFSKALAIPDFSTAVYVLDQIHTVYELYPNADKDTHLNRLKTDFVKRVYELVPAAVKPDASEVNLTKAETKQLVYVMQTIRDLFESNQIVAEKHFKEFTTADKFNLINIIKAVGTLIENSAIVRMQAISEILKDERNIQAIADLAPQLEQLWFSLSIPTRNQKSRLKGYPAFQEQLKAYAIGFRQRFVTTLEVHGALVSNDIYTDIALYLRHLTEQAWVKQLGLEAETAGKLTDAIADRCRALVAKIQDLPFQAGDHQQLEQFGWVIRELRVILDLSQVLPSALTDAIGETLDVFHQKVIATLRKIQTNCQNETTFEKLSAQEIKNFATYIDQCEKLSVDVKSVKEALTTAIQRAAKNKLVTAKTYFERLAELQRSNGKDMPKAGEMETIVPYLTATLGYLSHLDNGASTECTQYLVDNAANFADELTQALIERYAGDGSRFDQLLELCNSLKPLDQYIPKDNSRQAKNYSKTLEKFTALSQGKDAALFQNVLVHVRSGNYQEAVLQTQTVESLSIFADPDIRKVLRGQIASIVNSHIKKVNDKSAALKQSNIANDPSVPAVLADRKLLTGLQVLVDNNLLDPVILQNATQVHDAVPEAVKNWFANCAQRINQSISEFKVQDYLLNIKLLGDTLAQINPGNVERALQQLQENFQLKLQEVENEFKKSMASWNNQFTLAFIYNQLIGLNADKNQFARNWEAISSATMAAVDIECAVIERSIEQNVHDIAKTIDALHYIDNLVNGLPEENTQLKARVISRCKDCLAALMKKISNGELSFNDYFRNLYLVMQNQAKLANLTQGMDLSTIYAPLKMRMVSLIETIGRQLQENQFPANEFAEFIRLFNISNTFKGISFQSEFELCKDALGKFIKNTLAKLNQALGDPRNYRDIFTCLSLLVEMNQCHKDMSFPEDKALFDTMLPGNFSIDLKAYLKKIAAIFNDHLLQINEAFTNKDFPKLERCLGIVSEWKYIVPQLINYIETCDRTIQDDAEIQEAKACFEKHTTSHLESLVLKETSAMASRIVITPESYHGTSDKTEAARAKYYKDLTETVRFLNDCGNSDSVKNYYNNQILNGLLNQVRAYVTALFENARELVHQLTSDVNCDRFNKCYNELFYFARYCADGGPLSGLKLPNEITATNAAATIKDILGRDINSQVEVQKQQLRATKKDKDAQDNEAQIRSNLIVLIINLQRIINNATILREYVFGLLNDFLRFIQSEFGPAYLQVVAADLQSEESGLGRNVIDQQPCFKGVSIALYHTRTKAQGPQYVLEGTREKIGAREEGPLFYDEKEFLAQFDLDGNLVSGIYKTFQDKYNELIEDNLKPDIKNKDALKRRLKNLVTGLNAKIASASISAPHGRVTWDQKTTAIIPEMIAYIFAIWTLNDANTYFDNGNGDANYLKKPHAAQIFAIFRMLSVSQNTRELESHLAQVLTGEGKSIVIAATSAILALLGFQVNCVCYSRYLSERDLNDFKWIFELLGVDKHIQYGTFQELSERFLNANGDIRQRIRDAILPPMAASSAAAAAAAAAPAPEKSREVVTIVDEVDVFFDPTFYGEFYNSILVLQNQDISALINLIWNKHKAASYGRVSFEDIQNNEIYRKLAAQMRDYAYLLEKAVKEMLHDLNHYTKDKGHNYLISEDRKIAYRHLDTTTSDISEGYKTMWASFRECDIGKVDKEFRDQLVGLSVNCGNYLYTEIVREMRSRAILGVTGTLRELSPAEQAIIREKFGVNVQSFMPSVYGENKLYFPKNRYVKVAPTNEYYLALTNEINAARKGTTRDTEARNVRPVIVFFEDEATLTKFAKELAKSGDINSNDIITITNGTAYSKAEMQKLISDVTTSGKVTLAVKEFGRGRDTKCDSPIVDANSGVHVIETFLSSQLSEQIQLQGRTARQGLKGSFSMVLNESDLLRDYPELTPEAMKRMCDAEKLYEGLHSARTRAFTAKYAAITEQMKKTQLEQHEPSMALHRALQTGNVDEFSRTLKRLNAVPVMKQVVTVKPSKTLILIDGTGSMDPTIGGVKDAIVEVIANIAAVLTEKKIPQSSVSVQLAIYRNWSSSSSKIFETSDWSSDPEVLKHFISSVEATDGQGNEAIEIGAHHAVTQEDLSQVILIGDRQPNTLEEKDRNLRASAYREQHSARFFAVKHADEHFDELAKKKIPVHTRVVPNKATNATSDQQEKYTTETTASFAAIAAKTGGECETLDVSDKKKAAESIYNLFGERILKGVANGDAVLEAELMHHFAQRGFRGVGHLRHKL